MERLRFYSQVADCKQYFVGCIEVVAEFVDGRKVLAKQEL